MSNDIRVRMYNVHFGDAILVSVPDQDENGQPLTRHILIDVGNVLSGKGGLDDMFKDVLTDIANEVGGRGVDLYVMTHEHMDHVQGLILGSKLNPPITFPIHHAWLTASADPDYAVKFPNSKRALDDTNAVFAAIEKHLAVSPDPDPRFAIFMANNNPRATADCVAYLREKLVDDPARVSYVHSEFVTGGKHPFRTATLEVLAPEPDTSTYYGRFRPMAFGSDSALNVAARANVTPPAGVDARAFYDLVNRRENGVFANALAIDKAKNNTSVVFTLKWKGRTLLFAGDAEVRSWRTIPAEKLGPVDFLKVGHHGSHNGTPGPEILERILPLAHPPGDLPVAAVSTFEPAYSGVPHRETQLELERRARWVSTFGSQLFVDIIIPPAPSAVAGQPAAPKRRRRQA